MLGQDGGAALSHPVNLVTGSFAVVGNDERQHRGGEAEHHLVDDRRRDKVEQQTVDDGVHVPEHRAVEQNHRQRRAEGDVAERQVRALGLDGHGDEVQTAGAGVLHIDQRVADAHHHAAAQGGQHAVAGVHRQHGQKIIGKNGKQDHAPQTADKERTAQQFIAEQDDGDVDKNVAQTHGNVKQAVQDSTDTGNARNGDFGCHRKAVDARRRDKAAHDLQQYIEALVFCHTQILLSPTEKAGSMVYAPGQVHSQTFFLILEAL